MRRKATGPKNQENQTAIPSPLAFIHRSAVFIILSILSLIILLSCENQGPTGSIAVKLVLESQVNPLKSDVVGAKQFHGVNLPLLKPYKSPPKFTISTHPEISTVKIGVYKRVEKGEGRGEMGETESGIAGDFVVEREFPREAREGLLEKIPAGTDYIVIAQALAPHGEVVFEGYEEGVVVRPMETAIVGPIVLKRMIVPLKPERLEVSIGHNEVTLTWDHVVDAHGYKVYYDTDPGLPYEGMDADQGVSPITILINDLMTNDLMTNDIKLKGLKQGRDYYFAVTAFNDVGESGYSPEVVAVMVPGSPGGITAVGGVGQIDLSWDLVNGAQGYRIYYDIDSGDPYDGTDADQGVSPITIPTNDLMTNDSMTNDSMTNDSMTNDLRLTGLKDGTTYYILIKAFNAGGERGHEHEIAVTTIPSVPAGLTATAGGIGEVSLRWDSVLGADSYNVHYDSDASGQPYEGTGAVQGPSPITILTNDLMTNDPMTNDLKLTGLYPGYTYYFAVSALNRSGESGLSQEITVNLVPGGYKLVIGGIVGFARESVSEDKTARVSEGIFEPVMIQGNIYKAILK